jgi:NAD(P)-dependent dehydrogenase (short-subunit alcohol dehydrogenase family)
MYGLDGRVALVTGGTSDIGEACVARLREEGMTVGFTGRSAERGAAVAAATGAVFLRCDHRDRTASDRAVDDAVAAARGRLDVLVATAAVLVHGPVEATPEPAFLELLEVNLTALFRTSRACFGRMREQGGGSMIHVASDTGIRGNHTLAAYSVTQAGAVAVSELFAAEGAPHGVRSNAVCPGDGVRGDDAASLVAWLASDESSHMTGATLRLDDGAGAAMRAQTRA